jgi:hypothetical protein
MQKQKATAGRGGDDSALLGDPKMGKVRYELMNMFPAVNKMTQGRISTYCPIFISQNVHKELSLALVTNTVISQALDQIRKIDYAAFYREALQTDFPGNAKFYAHTQYLPDIILMPNVGSRGVMWQDVEGRDRATPPRMMLSLFHAEELYTTLARMTAEYRWEICKRIQGARWNDVSERSLTSEYCDYLQFYRKNHDLTQDAKEKIRTSLAQARNSFKEMFVRDYLSWLLFESGGMPRLNKVARAILFTHCPFSEDVCQSLIKTPFFTDLILRRATISKQKIHQLDLLESKTISDGGLNADQKDYARLLIAHEKKFIDGAP